MHRSTNQSEKNIIYEMAEIKIEDKSVYDNRFNKLNKGKTPVITQFINKLAHLGVNDITVEFALPRANTGFENASIDDMMNGKQWTKFSPNDNLPDSIDRYYKSFEKLKSKTAHKKIIAKDVVNIIAWINYPLNRDAYINFHMKNENIITYGILLYLYTAAYQLVYKLEDEDVGHETGHIPNMGNRLPSAGRFGIWGHDLGDMYYSGKSLVRIFPKTLVFGVECGS